MTSNTSKGRGIKGSKYWIQTLVNSNSGINLSHEIQKQDPSIGKITWLSPLADSYEEMRIHQVPGLKGADFEFWPSRGPWWDAIGKDEHGCVLLVEAKGHLTETKSRCTATSLKSLDLIRESMRNTHDSFAAQLHAFDENIWMNQYYQLGNRLTFLSHLINQGRSVKLVLLNFVNDSYIPTNEIEWNKHYQQVFEIMLGKRNTPNHVIMVNYKV
ncbi:hypothetical protein [Proteiniclasticum sp. QWL-01]|uniref:hypothetical protein n=1 Tax=Proteiniclasticum sp. QWL-01 TaxID=3036945 RepID=UPI00241196FB|nr:hypothetical protein [Proteiniclasticum sp. QWL-01]WFF74426.1 hypothetical protein P6M73_08245 [Proteiniclasticum sp. QWL-01]